MQITISDKIKAVCPDLRVAVLHCKVKNSLTTDELGAAILTESESIVSTYKLEDINKRPEIRATRKAYKALGKDPNRYRPSSEALCRRIVRGLPLYRLSTLVDIINLVSIRSGYSIGGFDAGKIQGDVRLEVGKGEDEFEAIGRGLLNIEGLPVYRDELGGIGTPTSDNERTKISDSTTNLLILINGYDGGKALLQAIDFSKVLLEKYAYLENFHVEILE